MADVTGGVPPTGASEFAPPTHFKQVYDHFGDPTMHSVATGAALPASGNWRGRVLTTVDDGAVWRWNGSWVKVFEDTGWVALPLNTWSDFGGAYAGAAYRRGPGSWVVLRGEIKNGTTLSPGTLIATLPAGFRPAAFQVFTVWNYNIAVAVEVGPSGQIVVGANTIVATRLSLNNIRFRAEQ